MATADQIREAAEAIHPVIAKAEKWRNRFGDLDTSGRDYVKCAVADLYALMRWLESQLPEPV